MSVLRDATNAYATTELVLLVLGCLSLDARLQAHVETHGRPTAGPAPMDDVLYAVLGAVAFGRAVRAHAATASAPTPRPHRTKRPALRLVLR